MPAPDSPPTQGGAASSGGGGGADSLLCSELRADPQSAYADLPPA